MTIDVKYVHTTKLNNDGSFSKYKERLVAKGFLYKHGIYYNEVFSLAARLEIVIQVLAICSSIN